MRQGIRARLPSDDSVPALFRNIYFLVLIFAFFLVPSAAHATDWQQPTPQELAMTSEPAMPGAAAICLYREETDDDQMHKRIVYVRMKILTDDGKRYADVEIPYERHGFNIGSVAGRTIHSDGTVIPFTGKPYDKLLVKSATLRYQAKIFSMPDVQVGSILEYRYERSYSDTSLYAPTWYIQGEVYVRKAHYRFIPYSGDVIAHGQKATALVWLPILPQGVAVQDVKGTGSFLNRIPENYQLDVENVLPEPNEDYAPPFHSFTYRVYFQYSAYKTPAEFWDKEGKVWSDAVNAFVGPGSRVKTRVNQLTTAADTPEQKLQKLYAEVMSYENTDFTRERTTKEEKAQGLQEVKTTDDIVTRKRGSGGELTLLFVSMARAAGLKAYVMKVTSRDDDFFNKNVMNMDQLDSNIAIVNVGGKEQYFDPGERYCPYGQLRWDHTMASGMRQTETGTAIDETPSAPYTDSRTIRSATLILDDKGAADGTVQMRYTGDPALEWRQRALSEDQTEVKKEMEEDMRHMLPNSLTVNINSIASLEDPSQPLTAVFHVQGPLANATSKRLFVPISLFEANEHPVFTEPKREMAIYFLYGYQDVDRVSIALPSDLEVESAPKIEDFNMQKYAVLREGSVAKDSTVVLGRNFAMGAVFFKQDEYNELRTFYSKVNHKDQEQLVLKVSGHATGN